MTRTDALPEPDLVYLDTTGDGTVDSFVSIDVACVDFASGAPAIWCVTETWASRIGLDGLPSHVRIIERFLADHGDGHIEEISANAMNLDPVDPDTARELIGRLDNEVGAA